MSYVFRLYIFIACGNLIWAQQIKTIPDGFLFGASSSAFQIEGAWNIDGKSESELDYLIHNFEQLVQDRSNADVADNSYFLYKRDVQMMRELGLNHYRFSLSWTRILPYNYTNKINPKGVEYYNNLIDEMLKYNIEPLVTIYHWDLPREMSASGGWTNPRILEWYSDYVRTVFKLFGDRVKRWITLNEPHTYCTNHYGSMTYVCIKNSLLGHAAAYHIYDKEFRHQQHGNIFISLSANFFVPATAKDVKAAEDANDFYWGLFAHPIYSKQGDFPESVKKRIAAKSREQGYNVSRLPELTPSEIDFIKGTADYFGVNHYNTTLVYRNESQNTYPVPSFFDDLGVQTLELPSWIIGESDYVYWTPWGFFELLTLIRKNYDNPPIFITENGYSTHGGLDDQDRIKYLQTYICAMLEAMEDGSDVRAYTVWSLADNFEWFKGYTERFGLYEVNFESEERVRTPRASAFMYRQILRTRSLSCARV